MEDKVIKEYLKLGWKQFPEEYLNWKSGALIWLNNFDICIYQGLNYREFTINDFDDNLTIQYGINQPRRFPATELMFKSI